MKNLFSSVATVLLILAGILLTVGGMQSETAWRSLLGAACLIGGLDLRYRKRDA